MTNWKPKPKSKAEAKGAAKSKAKAKTKAKGKAGGAIQVVNNSKEDVGSVSTAASPLEQ